MKRAIKFLTFIFVACFTISTAHSSPPKYWVCWATSTSNQENGTYGISEKKSAAAKLAMDLCQKEFGECALEYCEINTGS